jgi:hypothetical protein
MTRGAAPKLLMALDTIGCRLVPDTLQTPTPRQKSVLISRLEVATSKWCQGEWW